MPKVPKSFSIDSDLFEELGKKDNPSEFVNSLIRTALFNKSFKEQSLEEALKQADLLENEIIRQKQEERQKLDKEINEREQRKKDLDKQIQKDIDDNITLLETAPEELKDRLVNAMRESWDNMKLLDFVTEFRELGFNIGSRNLRMFLNSKGIFQPIDA